MNVVWARFATKMHALLRAATMRMATMSMAPPLHPPMMNKSIKQRQYGYLHVEIDRTKLIDEDLLVARDRQDRELHKIL